MAVLTPSLTTGLHSNYRCWKHHSRVWEGCVEHVELDRRRPSLTTTTTRSIRDSGLESVDSTHKGKRRNTIKRGIAILHCKGDDVDLGDCSINFSYGKVLSEISSWGIGGPAKMFVEVTTPTEMASVLRYCTDHNVRWFVVGKGSNCLFDDRGFDGCIILNRIDFLEPLGPGLYRVGSGYAFNMLGVQCSRAGFSGLEFAGGIPGTVGGAVYMNAGADGQETGNVVQTVEVVTTSGDSRALSRDAGELKFEYRTSPFQKMSDSAVIVAATFTLQPSSDAKQRQRMYLERRKKTQPVSERSAGCVFRNPGAGCASAGALIEKAGLKGTAIGGARVSDKHANFLLNGGGSKSHDMQALIAFIKEEVHKKFGLWLHDEVLYVPYNHEQG